MLTLERLKTFVFERVLSEDRTHRKIVFLGHIPVPNTAPEQSRILFIVEKTAFDVNETASLIHQRVSPPVIDAEQNDVYGWFLAYLSGQNELGERSFSPDVRIQYIYPATEKHIAKHTQSVAHIIPETPAVYEKLVLPYIESIPPSRIAWVFNILDRKKEVETFLGDVNDPINGYVILPDMKWDKQGSHFYYQLLVQRRDIRSLRDLRGKDILDWLKYLRAEIVSVVLGKHPDIIVSNIRMFIHYVPSYYHFHIHITSTGLADLPGINVGKAHLLETIIDNMELDPMYYAKRTLHVSVTEDSDIYKVMTRS
ncbi:HIT-like domain-containing protein [Cladochytrium replicatum]|nr:HIT-like domain-containing protein [Cladochytrium replicatum]